MKCLECLFSRITKIKLKPAQVPMAWISYSYRCPVLQTILGILPDCPWLREGLAFNLGEVKFPKWYLIFFLRAYPYGLRDHIHW